MSTPGYERFSKKSLRQGDIARAYVQQLIPRSGRGRSYPGSGSVEHLPDYGPFDELESEALDYRIRVWKATVIVLTQSCELERSNPDDSRVVVAPVFLQEDFGDEPFWMQLVAQRVPGYHHLPSMTEDEASALDLADPIPDAVVDFSGLCLTSRDFIKPRRFAKLHQDRLVELQDSYVRASTVRGLAPITSVMAGDQDIRGMVIRDARDTSITVPGPLRLAKVFLQGDKSDDEVEVAWGFRLPAPPR